MKYLPIALCGLVLSACSKSFNKSEAGNKIPENEKEKQTCTFGLQSFNMSKRAVTNAVIADSKPGDPGTGSTTLGGNVLLLDFNGQLVSGTSWNVSGDINAAPAGLGPEEISLIYQRVAADFAPFNITVTMDERAYDRAKTTKKMRVIVTESWEWYGQAAGTAFVNSFMWQDNTPCFVFSSLLGYNVKKIAEACSHEVGHTFGLMHQSAYDANGTMLSEYNWGQGAGEIGWAPIMGVAYNQNLSLWHRGPNSISSTTIQDEVAIISNLLGIKSDDYSNTIGSAASLSSLQNGVINSASDIDFFSLNLGVSSTLSVVPQNTGENNLGAALDIVLSVYNSAGAPVMVVNDPSILNASVTLPPGSYYISVGTTDNSFTTRYGMLGKYNISVM